MSQSTSDATPNPAAPPTVLDLFIAFAIISLSGFGGVLYWSRRMLVEQRKWMTPAEFNDAFALCQILPGPTIVNLSVVFGRSIRGLPGAAVALIGLIGPGMAIVIFFAFLYSIFGTIEALQRMLDRRGGRRRWPCHQFDRQNGGAAVRGEKLADVRHGGGGVRHHRPAALAGLVGAARPHPAEHRNRVAGAAMKHDGGILLTLLGYFALMSLFAVGGANGAIPEMHRLVVETRGWMTDRQFADMFALAQVTPGPNVIIVTLIGYHVAGIAGALVTTLGMCGPACAFALLVGRLWDRFKNARWRIAIQAGLVPVAIGLTAASALVVARAASTSWVSVALTIVAAAVSYRLTLNPLWVFAVAALLGLVGLV